MDESLDQYLTMRRAAIDRMLGRLVLAGVDWPDHLHRAIRYSLFPGGTRRYALLAVGGYEAVASVPDLANVLPIAAALEMLNVSIQVHDDLPMLNDKDSRDDLPTNHRVHGEALAILAGDALRARAFQVLADRSLFPAGVDACVLLDVAQRIAVAVGEEGAVGGQSASLGYEAEVKAPEHLAYLYGKRTGELMKASLLAGAMLAGLTNGQHKALSTFGDRLGLALSLTEDLALDTDLSEGASQPRFRPSITELIGERATREWISRAVDEALSAIRALDHRAEPLRAIAAEVARQGV